MTEHTAAGQLLGLCALAYFLPLVIGLGLGWVRRSAAV